MPNGINYPRRNNGPRGNYVGDISGLSVISADSKQKSELPRHSRTYIPRILKHDVNQSWMRKACDRTRTYPYTPY